MRGDIGVVLLTSGDIVEESLRIESPIKGDFHLTRRPLHHLRGVARLEGLEPPAF